MDRDQAAEDGRYPIAGFDYGGNGTITDDQRGVRQTTFRKRWSLIVTPLQMAEPLTTADRSKYRKWIDEDKDDFQNYTGSMDFWYRLLDKAPPPTDINLQRMIGIAAKIQLTMQLSSTVVWGEVLKTIEAVIREGHQNGWQDDSTVRETLPEREQLELFRSYGESQKPLGTWPSKLLTRLSQAGLKFLIVDPKKRIIPAS